MPTKLIFDILLNQYLLQKCEIVPYFIRNKLIKLVVDIGRIDWPHFYPDFFTNILQVVIVTRKLLHCITDLKVKLSVVMNSL